METDKIDRLLLYLFRALCEANYQSDNPTVWFRYVKDGIESFLRAEGQGDKVTAIAAFIDAKVSALCSPAAFEMFEEKAREWVEAERTAAQ